MAELDAVRALLPLWARLPGLLLLPASFALGFVVTALAARLALPRMRRLAGAHWTERARAALPARWVATVASFSVAASLATLAFFRAGPLLPVPAGVLAIGAGVSGYLGAMFAAAHIESQVGLGSRSRSRLALGRLGMLVVVYPHLLVLVVISCVVDGKLGVKDLVAASLGVSAYAVLSIWGGLPFARAFGAVHPASPKLRGAVDRAIGKTRIRPKALFEIDLPITNAFVLPLPNWLFFTRRCVAGLSEAELECVACHELGHVSEPTAVKLLRTGASFALLPLGFAPAFVGAFGVPIGLGIVYALVFAVAMPMRRLGRRMEARADAVAGHHEEDAGTYATALERLHEGNLMPAVGWSRGGSHPHLYDRMEAAGVTPAYPRPAPPSRARAAVGFVAGVTVLVALPFAVGALSTGYSAAPERRAALDVALFGGTADAFFQLAGYGANRAPEDAATFLRASLALRPLDHRAQARLAEALAELRRCDEGWLAYQAALDTLERQHWEHHADDCGWMSRAAQALVTCE